MPTDFVVRLRYGETNSVLQGYRRLDIIPPTNGGPEKHTLPTRPDDSDLSNASYRRCVEELIGSRNSSLHSLRIHSLRSDPSTCGA